MKAKSFLFAVLLTFLLLPAPLSAAEDRAEEVIQPPQSLDAVQDMDARDWERSVEAPVSWLTVEDHVLTLYDENGKEVYRAVYPSLQLTDDSTSPLASAFVEWNAEIGTGAWHSDVRSESEAARAERGTLPFAYTDIRPISEWGRVDDRMVSFFMEGSLYAGGAHPIPYVDAYTFDRATGRQIALDEIVTDREQLLTAIAAAFEAQYPDVIEREDFPFGIMEALQGQHPPENGLSGFCWYIAADGSLRIYYPNSVLTSYAAGDFALTITRADAPSLFTSAYPAD